MNIILFAILIILLLVVALWGVDYLRAPEPLNRVLKVLLIVLAIVLIAQRAGLF